MGFLVGIHGESQNADHTLTTANQQVIGVDFMPGGLAGSTLSYDGNALSVIGTVNAALRVFGLMTRFTVVNGTCNYLDGNQGVHVTYALKGLRTLTPFDAGSSGSGNGDAASLHVNGAPGCLAIGACWIDDDIGMSMTVPGVGNVADYTLTHWPTAASAVGHYIMPAGATSFHFEWSWATFQNYSCAALVLMPMTGGNQVVILAAERWTGFLRDLRAGLMPPDELRRRYREALAI